MEIPTRNCSHCNRELLIGRSEYYANDKAYCSEWCFKQTLNINRNTSFFENLLYNVIFDCIYHIENQEKREKNCLDNKEVGLDSEPLSF